MIEVRGHTKIKPVTNRRGNWRAHEKERRIHKQLIAIELMSSKEKLSVPLVVEFVRYSPRLLDCDNLPSCFKYMRDSIAEHYGVSDSPKAPIRWFYSQRQELIDGEKFGFTIQIKEERQ